MDDLAIPTLPNLRCVGGQPTLDGGRVRRGLLYRSTALNRLDGPDVEAFLRLGIRVVYDLRTDLERVWQPERLPAGVRYAVLDVLADAPGETPAQMVDTLTDPQAAREVFGDGRGAGMFLRKYREFVGLDSARLAFGRLFRGLLDGANLPALFHCSTGKDRTGWAAAALLLLLGVRRDLVLADYLASNDFLAPANRALLDAFAARGGDPELLRPLVGVQPDYLESGLAEMARLFGSIEAYFGAGLGIGDADQERLRTTFVERP